MFNRIITKLFLKLNSDKEIISKDELNDLEKAKRDYIELYKQNMYSEQVKYTTRREYDVKTYVAVEYVDRYFIAEDSISDYEERIKSHLVSKLADAVRENMTFERDDESPYGARYKATIKIVSKTAKEEA